MHVTTTHRITMAEVDAVQVNFIAYFGWMDKGFHELLAGLGHPLTSILATGYGTPAVDARCSYLKAAGLDDVVTLLTSVARVGRASFDIDHQASTDAGVIARGVIRHVWIELGSVPRPMPVPDWLRAAASVGAA
jgi:acyl-CoA thioesterase FadM